MACENLAKAGPCERKMTDTTHLESAENEVEFVPLSEAAKLTGYTPEYLNMLSRKKKLKAKKIGRNWHTKKEWIAEFLAQNLDGLEDVTAQSKIPVSLVRDRSYFSGSELPEEEVTGAFVEKQSDEKTGAIEEEKNGSDETKAFGMEKVGEPSKDSKANEDGVNRGLKIFAVMSSAIIILPLIFAGTQIAKIVVANSRKNSELAKIYVGNKNLETKIFNENVGNGKVAGIETTQSGSTAILASANFRVNSINVGGNTLVFSNESNQPLRIDNIKSDSFADNKKNETSLVVAWQTNKMSISELDYSKSGGQNPETLAENSYGFNHSAVISGLEPGASYVFQIKSKDRWANEISSDFFGVYTASKPVSVFDLISNAVGEVFGWAIKK